ncbi:hypothetical protein Tco_0526728 [Tanacetum coccineum]
MGWVVCFDAVVKSCVAVFLDLRADGVTVCKKQTVVANSTTEAEYVAASSCCGQVLWIQNQLLDYDCNEKKLIQMVKIHTDKNVADLLTKAFDVPQRSDPIENVIDEAVYKELGDSWVRAATTASSLEAEQDSGNINKTQSKATPNESSSQGNNSGGGPWCQKTMGDTIAQTRFKSVSKHSNDSLLARDEEIIMVSVHDVNVSAGEEVFATTIDYITFAQVLEEMKSIKPKKKRVVIQELGEYTTTISSQLSLQQSHDKGKGILIEHVKPMNKKDLIRLDEETALNLQAEFDEEERLAREKAEKELNCLVLVYMLNIAYLLILLLISV